MNKFTDNVKTFSKNFPHLSHIYFKLDKFIYKKKIKK